jgi:hypothetical protein
MPETGRTQPKWGRALGAVLAVIVLIAINREAWEVVVVTAAAALLVGGYLLRRHARRRSVYHGHGG